jgi:flagellin-like protein
MNKKGITPVIAVILLMMMTVAAAGAAFFWFVRIQGELQSGGENYAAELSETINSNLDVRVVDYVSGDLEIYLRNIGGIDIPVNTGSDSPTTSLILQKGDGTVICQTYLGSAAADCTTGCGNDIEVGETQELNIDLASDCSLTSYSSGELISFSLDFSGQVGTGGEFKI